MSLIFVTGKGGVGKSTIVAALAKLFSEQYKVGIVELNQTRMASLFNVAPPCYKGTKIRKNLTLFNLNPTDAFEEYVAQTIPKHFLFFLRNRWVEHFIHAVPGLNEILLLGKVASLLKTKNWEFLFLDAPATGHAIALCKAPQIAEAALKKSPLQETITAILELLQNPKQTSFLFVTQPEESIVQETIDFYGTLTKQLEISLQSVIVNRVFEYEFPFETKDLKECPKPFLKMKDWIKSKMEEQKNCLKNLQQNIPLSLQMLPSIENIDKECLLKDILSERMKPWVSKIYSQRKN